MKRNGFSLLELLVVIAIMVTLMSIAGLLYSSMTRKAGIENQVKMMYTDLMTARSEALYRKTSRYVAVTATQFSVYSSADLTVSPILQKTLKHPVTFSPSDTLFFDPQGVANLTDTDITSVSKTICAQQNDPGFLTSIVIKPTSIQMGKLSAGGACNGANIAIQ